MAKGQCDLAFAMVALMLRRAPIAAVARSIGRYPPCNKMYHIEELPTRTSRNCGGATIVAQRGLQPAGTRAAGAMPSTEEVRRAFALFDANGDGMLSLDELKAILCRPTPLQPPLRRQGPSRS